MIFNADLPRVGASFPQPAAADLPPRGFKRCSTGFVRARATPFVRDVLDRVPLEGLHRFVLVDVRVTAIRPGVVPGIPGWHVDVVGDPRHAARPEVHHLLVTGSASLTEFVVGPAALDVPDGLPPHAVMRALGAQVEGLPTWRVPSATLVRYGRHHLHRPTPGRDDEVRLLVRVTETDVVPPYDR